MTKGSHFTEDDAKRIGSEIGIDWRSSRFDVEQFRPVAGRRLARSAPRAGSSPHSGRTGPPRSRACDVS